MRDVKPRYGYRGSVRGSVAGVTVRRLRNTAETVKKLQERCPNSLPQQCRSKSSFLLSESMTLSALSSGSGFNCLLVWCKSLPVWQRATGQLPVHLVADPALSPGRPWTRLSVMRRWQSLGPTDKGLGICTSATSTVCFQPVTVGRNAHKAP